MGACCCCARTTSRCPLSHVHAHLLLPTRLLAFSGFPFPITLTMWHMSFCSAVGFICVRVLGITKAHNLSLRDYTQRVLPIGEALPLACFVVDLSGCGEYYLLCPTKA